MVGSARNARLARNRSAPASAAASQASTWPRVDPGVLDPGDPGGGEQRRYLGQDGGLLAQARHREQVQDRPDGPPLAQGAQRRAVRAAEDLAGVRFGGAGMVAGPCAASRCSPTWCGGPSCAARPAGRRRRCRASGRRIARRGPGWGRTRRRPPSPRRGARRPTPRPRPGSPARCGPGGPGPPASRARPAAGARARRRRTAAARPRPGRSRRCRDRGCPARAGRARARARRPPPARRWPAHPAGPSAPCRL